MHQHANISIAIILGMVNGKTKSPPPRGKSDLYNSKAFEEQNIVNHNKNKDMDFLFPNDIWKSDSTDRLAI